MTLERAVAATKRYAVVAADGVKWLGVLLGGLALAIGVVAILASVSDWLFKRRGWESIADVAAAASLALLEWVASWPGWVWLALIGITGVRGGFFAVAHAINRVADEMRLQRERRGLSDDLDDLDEEAP